MAERVEKSLFEWKAVLSPQAYRVARKRGTEAAFSGAYWDEEREGLYRCVCCHTPLFHSSTKFDSGTGWPSFWRAEAPEKLVQQPDTSLWMERTELLCAVCDAHLGHLFDDGPQPTGKRYCLNSAALDFVPGEGPPG